jgi:ribonuclease VapC
MFVDASAIVAILTREPGYEFLVTALEAARAPQTSPIAIFEAVLGVRRKRYCAVAEAQEDVAAFLKAAAVTLVPVGLDEAYGALDAFARFGKWTGHPAQLNMGDCFAYAAARGAGVALLYTGDDLGMTDARGADAR